MAEIGYSLSSEEGGLVDLAERAEQVGFSFALISDHFHPWTSRQGQSPFVWAVIGGIARATRRLRLGSTRRRRFRPRGTRIPRTHLTTEEDTHGCSLECVPDARRTVLDG